MKRDTVKESLITCPNNRGITLIALVITIIVMLILVGVTITMAVNGGLFENAGRAAQGTNNAVQKEKELADEKITVGDTPYESINDYIDNVTAVTPETITFYIRTEENNFETGEDYTIYKFTTVLRNYLG